MICVAVQLPDSATNILTDAKAQFRQKAPGPDLTAAELAQQGGRNESSYQCRERPGHR